MGGKTKGVRGVQAALALSFIPLACASQAPLSGAALQDGTAQQNGTARQDGTARQKASLTPEGATAPKAAEPRAQEAIAREVLYAWSDAHESGRAKRLKALFAPQVYFYGTELTNAECVARKSEYLAAHPDFVQRVGDDIRIESEVGRIRIAFTKIVTTDKPQQYESYLELIDDEGSWRIAVEGDKATDEKLANLARRNSAAMKRTFGDFDGDGLTESMEVEAPEILDVYECRGSCSCKVAFSTQKIEPIVVENCVGASLFNEGDLDGDGSDEVGVAPEWFTSCWSGFPVYSLTSGSPRLRVGVSTHCAQFEEGIHPVEKHPSKPGAVILHSTILGEDGFVYTSEERELGE